MGKKKKKLSEIKDALLSKTSYIGNNEEVLVEIPVADENAVILDRHILSKMKMLAKFYNKSHEELINEALSHYLRLKKLDIDEALKHIVVGSEDDE